VERAAASVEDCGERAGDGIWESAETLDQDEQCSDEEKAEQHVELELFVRPFRSVGLGAKLAAGGGADQFIEVGRDPLHVGVDVADVHRRLC
jgi:hypothetical protein